MVSWGLEGETYVRIDSVLELGLYGCRGVAGIFERRHRLAAESYGQIDIAFGRGADVDADLRVEEQPAGVVLHLAERQIQRALGREPPAERQCEEGRYALLEEIGAEVAVERNVHGVKSHRAAILMLGCGVVQLEIQARARAEEKGVVEAEAADVVQAEEVVALDAELGVVARIDGLLVAAFHGGELLFGDDERRTLHELRMAAERRCGEQQREEHLFHGSGYFSRVMRVCPCGFFRMPSLLSPATLLAWPTRAMSSVVALRKRVYLAG